MDDLMAQLAQMQRYTATLQSLINTAQRQAPQRSEGSDKTGTVHVVLDQDGLPQSFQVSSDWQRRLNPDSFGGAVLESCQSAIEQRLSTWTQSLQEDGWDRQAVQTRIEADDQSSGTLPPALSTSIPHVTPRPIGDVAEDAIKAFDTIGKLNPKNQSGGGTGSSRNGELTITLSPSGLTSCTADARWASNQTAARLMDALSEALSAARRNLAQESDNGEKASQLDGLFAEAMALLKDPTKTIDS